MTNEQFNKNVDLFIDQIKAVLQVKNNEYNLCNDRLDYFKRYATIDKTTPQIAVKNCMMKHIISLLDMLKETENNKKFTKKMWLEKMIDLTNYLIILYCINEETNNFKED